MSKAKLIDVAKEAGVSKSTVSQFLNGRFSYMSKDTRGRIQEAIDKLHYIPNNIARSLKTDKTRTLGVIVRDIAGFYTSQAIRGMDDYCKDMGYDLFIYNTDFDPEVEAKALRSLKQLRIDGLIIASSGNNVELMSDLANNNTPVVEFQLEHDDSAKNIIVSDYKRAAFEATEYLIELGHSRICFVTQEYEKVKSRYERFQGYLDALAKHNIRFDDSLIQFWERDSGMSCPPKTLLEQANPPSAFFTQHLAITTDLISELDRAGINVPNDVSVIGFDEIPMTEFFKVPITVVEQKPYQVGHEAARLLIHHIANTGSPLERVMIPCNLTKRQSCRSL